MQFLLFQYRRVFKKEIFPIRSREKKTFHKSNSRYSWDDIAIRCYFKFNAIPINEGITKLHRRRRRIFRCHIQGNCLLMTLHTMMRNCANFVCVCVLSITKINFPPTTHLRTHFTMWMCLFDSLLHIAYVSGDNELFVCAAT